MVGHSPHSTHVATLTRPLAKSNRRPPAVRVGVSHMMLSSAKNITKHCARRYQPQNHGMVWYGIFEEAFFPRGGSSCRENRYRHRLSLYTVVILLYNSNYIGCPASCCCWTPTRCPPVLQRPDTNFLLYMSFEEALFPRGGSCCHEDRSRHRPSLQYSIYDVVILQ